jgi:hypothetical protein
MLTALHCMEELAFVSKYFTSEAFQIKTAEQIYKHL